MQNILRLITKYGEKIFYLAIADVISIWINTFNSLISWNNKCQITTSVTCLSASRVEIVRTCLRYLSYIMNFEQRANIKFCFNLQKSANEAHEMLKSVYGDNGVTLKTVYMWYERFEINSKWVDWRRATVRTSFDLKNKRKRANKTSHCDICC